MNEGIKRTGLKKKKGLALKLKLSKFKTGVDFFAICFLAKAPGHICDRSSDNNQLLGPV